MCCHLKEYNLTLLIPELPVYVKQNSYYANTYS